MSCVRFDKFQVFLRDVTVLLFTFNLVCGGQLVRRVILKDISLIFGTVSEVA